MLQNYNEVEDVKKRILWDDGIPFHSFTSNCLSVKLLIDCSKKIICILGPTKQTGIWY